MDLEQEEAAEQQQHIEWLKFQSPKEWHRFACEYNWDDAITSLFWIVQQPECERATALTIFWAAEPSAYFDMAAEATLDSYTVTIWELVQYIAARFSADGYPNCNIPYRVEAFRLGDYQEMQDLDRKFPGLLRLHPDLVTSFGLRSRRPDAAGIGPASLNETSLFEARIEVMALVIYTAMIGLGIAFLALKASRSLNPFYVVILVVGLGICAHSARKGQRDLDRLLRLHGRTVSRRWYVSLLSGGGLLGAGLAALYFRFGETAFQSIIANHGLLLVGSISFAVIIAALVLLGFGIARLVIKR